MAALWHHYIDETKSTALIKQIKADIIEIIKVASKELLFPFFLAVVPMFPVLPLCPLLPFGPILPFGPLLPANLCHAFVLYMSIVRALCFIKTKLKDLHRSYST